jgi:HK97 family phage portal protein
MKQKAAEGEYRPGPYLLDSGWLSAKAGKFWNFWQMGYGPQPYGECGAMVEAAVSAYSQTVAMCPGDHKRSTGNGGVERVTTSDLSRIIRKPNDYQSMSDFLLNLTRRLYMKGEAFALARRNERNEISELHWMRDGYPLVGTDGSVFYWLSGNEIAEKRFDLSVPFPARDVLHVRLHTPRHPLKGESPILAVALDLMMSGAALNQQVTFYLNQARPSFMLETDQQLTKEQTDALRIRWDEQTKGENAGGTPILAWGLKAKPVTVGAGDARLADMLKLSDQNVALAFRMPLQILGIGGTPFASTEALMSSWKAMGLGFALNHIEEAFGILFRLKGFPEEYVEFDTNALLRSSFKEMIDALSNGTRRVMTTNEARRYLDLPEKPGGDELLVQLQDIPLSMAGKQQTQPKAPAEPKPEDNEDEPGADADADERAAQFFRSGYDENRITH